MINTHSLYRKCGKRLLDITLSTVGFVVLLIPMLVISIVVFVSDPGPVLFKQKRIGKKCDYFYIYKFRSMKTNTPDIPTHLMANPEDYLIACGKWLRRYSLDELPQLINIIKGDMSIVGPRPALWNQDDLIVSREQCGVNTVRPGLTGWAQINGRDEISVSEKVAYDAEYVNCLSFSFDLKCFFMTFSKVFSHDGVSEGVDHGK